MGLDIVLIEDEKDVVDFVTYFLQKEGYQVFSFLRGEAFLEKMDTLLLDIIILDLMLPGIDGLEVFRYIREHPRFRNVPIIMLTAKSDPLDVVLGLEVGADDYITKPFHPRELLARIKAVVRRASLSSFSEREVLKIGDFWLDSDHLMVKENGKETYLSWREFRLFELLIKNRGKVISRQQILDSIWGEDSFITDRIVDVYIANLRKKLGDSGNKIVTVRGVGYKFESA